jgi:formylglycine-generating enzyme required for sulfatase activity
MSESIQVREVTPVSLSANPLLRRAAAFSPGPPDGMGGSEAWVGHRIDPDALVALYGRTEVGYRDAPLRLVQLLGPFLLQRFPVTNALFTEFMHASRAAGRPYITTAEKRGGAWVLDDKQWRWVSGACWHARPNKGQEPDSWLSQPVVCVSWHDATAFAEWCSHAIRGDDRFPAGAVARLPTEAEWEFACRAGTEGPFWWGDMLDDEHSIHSCLGSPHRTSPEPIEADGRAGQGRSNPWGFSDMSGNVWEWCADLYEEQSTDLRVLRGGSWGTR